MNQQPTMGTPLQPEPQSPQPVSSPPQDQIAPTKKNTRLIVGIIIGIVAFIIIIGGILAAMVLTSLNSTNSKAKEAKIRADISALRTDAEMFASDNNGTYVGWTIKPEFQQGAQSVGTTVYIQNTSKTSYVIYAKLPSSGKYVCADATGQILEINKIMPTQKTCK